MSMHTPGPWTYNKNINGELNLFGENGRTVILSNFRLVNQDANLKLIAAAPEMLEALQSLLYYVDTDDMRVLDLNKIRSIIAKAKGE